MVTPTSSTLPSCPPTAASTASSPTTWTSTQQVRQASAAKRPTAPSTTSVLPTHTKPRLSVADSLTEVSARHSANQHSRSSRFSLATTVWTTTYSSSITTATQSSFPPTTPWPTLSLTDCPHGKTSTRTTTATASPTSTTRQVCPRWMATARLNTPTPSLRSRTASASRPR